MAATASSVGHHAFGARRETCTSSGGGAVAMIVIALHHDRQAPLAGESGNGKPSATPGASPGDGRRPIERPVTVGPRGNERVAGEIAARCKQARATPAD